MMGEDLLNLRVAENDEPGGRITVRGKGGKVVVYPILTDRLKSAIKAQVKKSDAGYSRNFTTQKCTRTYCPCKLSEVSQICF